MPRDSRHIEERGFKLVADLEVIKDVNPQMYTVAVEQSKRVANVIGNGKRYSRLGDGACDTLFVLEALGVGDSCRKYTVIIDFSNALDYILHRITNCSMENIRKLNDYERVSRCVINQRYSELTDISFQDLFELDDNLAMYLGKLLNATAEEYTEKNKIVSEFSAKFYKEITHEVAKIKDYCILYLRKLHKGDFVYRSKSYAASIATSSIFIDDTIEIISNGYENYTVAVKSYEKFEFASKGVI